MFSVSFNSAVLGIMERECSSKPAGAESSNVLQKLQDILHSKDIQVALIKLGIFSSEPNLSVVKDSKSNADTSKLKPIDELKSVDDIPNDSTSPEGMKGKDQRKMVTVMNGRKLLTDSRASNSTELIKMQLANSSRDKIYVNSRNGKQVMQGTEIEQLSKRLKFLEEENRILKQEFLEHVEERKQMVNEIYQHFRIIYHCLQLENPEYEERCFDESYVMDPHEKGDPGTGLSEVIYQDSSSSNSARGQRTNALALSESPEE